MPSPLLLTATSCPSTFSQFPLPNQSRPSHLWQGFGLLPKDFWNNKRLYIYRYILVNSEDSFNSCRNSRVLRGWEYIFGECSTSAFIWKTWTLASHPDMVWVWGGGPTILGYPEKVKFCIRMSTVLRVSHPLSSFLYISCSSCNESPCGCCFYIYNRSRVAAISCCKM